MCLQQHGDRIDRHQKEFAEWFGFGWWSWRARSCRRLSRITPAGLHLKPRRSPASNWMIRPRRCHCSSPITLQLSVESWIATTPCQPATADNTLDKHRRVRARRCRSIEEQATTTPTSRYGSLSRGTGRGASRSSAARTRWCRLVWSLSIGRQERRINSAVPAPHGPAGSCS